MESLIKKLCLEVGFDAVGLVPADQPPTLPSYDRWLQEGLHGEMDYLETHRHLKADPRLLLPGARSWIALALRYDTTEPLSVEHFAFVGAFMGWVSRYARGRDYHRSIQKKLKSLIEKLMIQFPQAQFRGFVDSGPVLERDLARRAGLGWIGKNTMLIHEGRGSFFFIAEILTTLELKPDTPPPDRCGSCTKCLEICPTGALVEPRKLDATKCISYWTIESEKAAPDWILEKMGIHLFGCDLCQDVCPWNQKARRSLPLPAQAETGWVDLRNILEESDGCLQEKIRGTPLARAGVGKLKERARQILGAFSRLTSGV